MDIHITKLKGLDPKVYTTLGPLVMDKKVMEYFEMYPVITSEDHMWYVVQDAENFVCAFAAVVCNKTVFSLREFYFNDDKCPRIKTFTTLMDSIIKDIKDKNSPVSAFCRAEDYELWRQYGFEPTRRGKNWYTLRMENKKKGVQS
jgi:hypothetical protein